MDDSKYIKDRVDDQINWYSKKSTCCQKRFKQFRACEIIIAAAIPLLSCVELIKDYYPLIVGSFGATIAILAGLIALFKDQENWIKYRTTCETLRHEKYLYETKCSHYNSNDAFCIFVQRIEGIISKENSSWSRNASKTD